MKQKENDMENQPCISCKHFTGNVDMQDTGVGMMTSAKCSAGLKVVCCLDLGVNNQERGSELCSDYSHDRGW